MFNNDGEKNISTSSISVIDLRCVFIFVVGAKMKNEDFRIVGKIRELMKYCDDYVFSSFPKKDLALKINLEKCLYSLHEECLRARLNVGNIRVKHIKELVINISLIDYYIGTCSCKKIITSKRYFSIMGFIDNLNKMVGGLLLGEEKRKSI